VALALAPATARAGGAPFPTAQSVFVPADRPGEILVGTTFGVVRSEDGGGSWIWTCDQWPRSGPPYQLGPAPRHRLFALGGGLVYSDDGGCTWQPSGGLLAADNLVSRVFVDPSNADRVLATAVLSGGDGGSSYAVLASGDGGATFDSVRYASAVDRIWSVEGARTDPATIYLTLYMGVGGPPTLVRSADGGATWQQRDLSGDIGPGAIDIVAVDPSRADRVFLRQVTATDEAFVIAEGGGAMATRAFGLPSETTVTFARAADGTMLVGALTRATAALFRSRDDGASFASLAAPPHVHALAERAGVFYAATDSPYDDADLETSTDDGTTWQPAMSFHQVQAIAACAKAVCQTSCASMASDVMLWPPAVCSADEPPPPSDAGADARDAAATATDGAAPDAPAASDARVARDARDDLASSSGCGCALRSVPHSSPWGAWMLGALAAGLARRLRRSRSGRACGVRAPARRAPGVRAT
jgi:MYXO-CTERM domain-containing protein